jgi:S-adenosylmethionine decarboxylase
MNVGSEWLVEAEGCAADLLCDTEYVRRVCEQIINDLDLHVVGDPAWHKFAGPGGVTGLFLLTESHLACHTYPEMGIATFNLYCCTPRPAWPWRERLGEMLFARRVWVRCLDRGAGLEGDDLENHFQKAISQQEGVRR